MASTEQQAGEERTRYQPRARDVMTRAPLSLRPDDTLAEALTLMVKERLRHLPIVDGEGRLSGIISDRILRELYGDLVGALIDANHGRLAPRMVSSAMIGDPISVEADTPLTEVARILLDERIGAVPVVDEKGKLVGMLSYVDLLYHAYPIEEQPRS